MSRWTMGCGGIAIIAIVVIGVVGYQLASKMGEFASQQAEVQTTYRDAEAASPFSLGIGVEADPTRFAAYLRVRKVVATAAAELLDNAKKSSGPFLFASMIQGYISTSRDHANALAREKMSLSEYRFFDQEVTVMLEENDPALSPLRDARTDLLSRLKDLPINSPEALLQVPFKPLLAGGRVVIPEGDRTLIRTHAPDLIESSDAALIDFLSQIASRR